MVNTLEYAENTDVFYIQVYITFKDEEIFNVGGFYIGKCSLYDFVMASAEETTSPRGVERKLHIREVGLEKERNVFYTHYEVWNWGWRGQNPKRLEIFETEVEAIAYIYELTEKFDFANDCNRDTRYYLELTEVMNELAIMLGEKWRVSEDVAAHIIRKHKDIVPGLLAKREKEQKEKEKEEDERIRVLAEQYAKMIDPKHENFKETATRLSNAIGERIESAVFYNAVKLIRQRFNK